MSVQKSTGGFARNCNVDRLSTPECHKCNGSDYVRRVLCVLLRLNRKPFTLKLFKAPKESGEGRTRRLSDFHLALSVPILFLWEQRTRLWEEIKPEETHCGGPPVSTQLRNPNSVGLPPSSEDSKRNNQSYSRDPWIVSAVSLSTRFRGVVTRSGKVEICTFHVDTSIG